MYKNHKYSRYNGRGYFKMVTKKDFEIAKQYLERRLASDVKVNESCNLSDYISFKAIETVLQYAKERKEENE